MCGIVGHFAFTEHSRVDADWISRLNDQLVHRGPDEGGTFLSKGIALGMRRLAIIDVEEGTQPFSSHDGRYTMVFNGEIYNYKELRSELLASGYRLRTQSDTEVLLTLFIQKGERCLQDLNGMFAFAIWDDVEESLFLARDRMGIKPLYYCNQKDRFLFSSELTPILKSGILPPRLNLKTLSNYLAYWYPCEPETFFHGIAQVPPGFYAHVSKQGKTTTAPYWQIPVGAERNISFDNACQELEALLSDAINIQTRADVPYGTFLSGGIDSGMITALTKKVSSNELLSFAIGFKDPSYCELSEAQASADHLSVSLRSVKTDVPTPSLLAKVIASFDEPLGNASYFATYLLAERAREDVKVVLTGDGGDELFGGYPTYQVPYYKKIYDWVPSWIHPVLKKIVESLPTSHSRISFDYRLKQLMQGIQLPIEEGHFVWRQISSMAQQETIFKPEVYRELLEHDPSQLATNLFREAREQSPINRLMYMDLKTYLLNDHLRKVDRMTMAHPLEILLHHNRQLLAHL
jgi:asparagine synthase (glutamine-hydrolysing)